MKLSPLFALAVPAAFTIGCAQQICEKEFACQEELGLNLDDDYADVCVARLEGRNNVLNANAEPECDDLATKLQALEVCEAALSCEDLAASRNVPGSDGDKCKIFRTSAQEATVATNGFLACDGVADPEEPGAGGEPDGGSDSGSDPGSEDGSSSG